MAVQFAPFILLTLTAFSNALPGQLYPKFFPRVSQVYPRQSNMTCYSGVYMIVARGSGAPPGEGASGQVADMIAAQVSNSASVAVNYPANFSDYSNSVTAGIIDTKSKIQNYVAACGDSSRVVLLGSSQGGNVMTDVLAGGQGQDPLDSSYMPYITAVAVFGDPSWIAGQSFDSGSPEAAHDGRYARDSDSLAVLNTYANVLQSYCDENDYFCASGYSLKVHNAEVSTNAQAATDFVVGLANQ